MSRLFRTSHIFARTHTTSNTTVVRVRFVVFAFLALALFVSTFALYPYTRDARTRTAVAATNGTLNFQARILTNTGAVVPDGSYNVQFKIYDGGTSGGPAGAGEANAGTLLWTESWQNNASQGIVTKNGYITASLGSITAFSGINWDQELWITMNIGGTTAGAPTYNGEMLMTGNKRIRITAVPYAFSAGKLQTTSGANSSTLSILAPTVGSQTFQLQDQGASGTYNICVQNATSAAKGACVALGQATAQTDGSTNASIFINKSGASGNLLQLQQGTDKFVVSYAGNVTGGTYNGLTLTSAADGFTVAGGTTSRTLTVTGANITVGSTITPTAAGALAVQSNGANNLTLDTGAGATVNIGTGNATTVAVGNAATTTLNIGSVAPTANRTTTINGGNGTAVTDTVNIATGTSTTSGGKAVNIATGVPGAGTTNTVAIGTAGAATGTVGVTIGSIGAANHTTTIQAGANGANTTLALQAASGGVITIGNQGAANTVNLGTVGAAAFSSTVNIGTSSGAAQTVAIGSTNGASGTTISAGTGNLLLTTNNASASIIARSQTGAATAFAIQDSGSAPLLVANTVTRAVGTAGNTIKIGDSTGTDTATTVLILDAATAVPTTNLASLNGGLFYNSTTNKISIVENGTVKVLCNTTDLGCGAGGTFLAKNATDTSSAAAGAGYVYGFTNSSAASTGGVLQLDNGTNTGNALRVTTAGNPAAGSAVIFASNTNAAPSGNLLDLQSGAAPTSKFSVSATGAVTSAGAINGLTLTSAADGFTVAGGTTSRTLTVTGANITVGSTITPTAAGALSVTANGANTLSLDGGTTGAVNINGSSSGDVNIAGGSATTGCTITNSTGALTCTAGITSNSNTINTNTFSSTALTFAGAGATTIQSASGQNLTLQTAGTGNLAVSATGTGTVAINTAASTTVSTSGITIQSGNASVGANLSAGTVAIDTGTKTGTGTAVINIGGTNATNVNLGASGVANTIQIGQSGATAVTQSINIGTGSAGSTTNVTVGNANAGTLILQGAARLSALTTNGFVKTTSANGTLAVSTSVALGSEVSGILPAANGGTGNGFTAFTGPTTTTKTFTLPDVSTTICTTNSVCAGYQASGSYATTTLNNLGVTSINAALLASANNSWDIGASATGFKSGYFATSVVSPLFTSNAATNLAVTPGTTGTLTLSTAASTTVNTAALTIQSGNASVGANLSAGTVTIDTGTKTGTGTATINVGNTNATAINLGVAGTTVTTVSGGLNVRNNNNAFAVQSASGANQYFSVDPATALVQIGASAVTSANLRFYNASNSNTITLVPSTSGVGSLTLPAETGTVCTTAATGACSTAAGGYVQLAPSSIQTDAGANASIFINKTAGTNFIQFQNATADKFIVTNAGAVTAGGDYTFQTGATRTISVATAAANTAGNQLSAIAGAGNGTGAGGVLNLRGGAGGATGAGGDISLTAGAGGATSGNGGNITLVAGTKTSGTAGGVTVKPGAAGNDSAALFQVQTAAGVNAINLNTTYDASNLLSTNPSFEVNTTGWAPEAAGGSIARTTTAGQFYYGNAGGAVTTTTTAGTGVRYNLTLTDATTYNITIPIKGGTAFSTLEVGYASTGLVGSEGTAGQNCTAQSVTTSWGFVSCTITTTTHSGTPYIYIKQTDAGTARTFYIDGAKVVTAATGNLGFVESHLSLQDTTLAINTTSDTQAALTIQQRIGQGGILIKGSGEANLFQQPLLDVQNSIGSSVLRVLDGLNTARVVGGNSLYHSAGLTTVSGGDAIQSLNVYGNSATQTGDLLRVQKNAGATSGLVVTAGGKVGINTAVVNTNDISTVSYDLTLGQGADRTIGVETQATAATAGNNLTITAGTGNTTGAGGNLILSGGAKATGSSGSVIIKPQASNDSATALMVQNAAGTASLLTVDTSANQTVLGKTGAGGIDGKLVFNNASNAFTVTLQPSNSIGGSYSLTLPASAGSPNQCLQNSGTAGVLTFAACAANLNLQTSYNTSAGATPSIAVNTGFKAVVIQNSVTTGIAAGNEYFGVRAAGASDIVYGNSIFTVNSGGVGINIGGTGNPTTSFDLSLGQGANRTIGVQPQATAATAGNNLTVTAGTGNTTGAGGNVILSGGAKATGSSGSVIVRPQASNDGAGFFQLQNAAGSAFVSATSDSANLTNSLVVSANTVNYTSPVLTVDLNQNSSTSSTPGFRVLNGVNAGNGEFAVNVQGGVLRSWLGVKGSCLGGFLSVTRFCVETTWNSAMTDQVNLNNSQTITSMGTGTHAIINNYIQTNVAQVGASGDIFNVSGTTIDLNDTTANTAGVTKNFTGLAIDNTGVTNTNSTTTVNGITVNNPTAATGNLLLLQGAATTAFSVSNTGAVLSKNTTDSTTAFQIQNAAGANMITVDNASTNSNLITNPSAEVNTTGWNTNAPRTGTTLSRTTTAANVYYGVGAIDANVTTGATTSGVNYPITLTAGVTYNATVMMKLTTNGNVTFGYAHNGTEGTYQNNACYGGSAGTGWYICSFTFTPATVSGSPYFFIKQNDTVVRHIYIDGLRVWASGGNSLYQEGAINIGNAATPVNIGGSLSNPITSMIGVVNIQQVRDKVGLQIRGTPENDLFRQPILNVETSGQFSLLNVNEAQAVTQIQGGSAFWGSAALRVLSNDAGATALRVMAAPSQTGNIFEVTNNGGTDLFVVGSGGDIGINTPAAPTHTLEVNTPYSTTGDPAEVFITSSAAGTVPLVVQMAASPTVNAFQVRSSTGTVVSGHTGTGRGFYGATGPVNGLAVLSLSTGVNTNEGIVVQGTASQAADYFRIQTNAAANVFKIDSAGNVTSTGNILGPNVGLGAVSAGYYGDTTNLAIRAVNNAGGLYIQTNAGGATQGYWNFANGYFGIAGNSTAPDAPLHVQTGGNNWTTATWKKSIRLDGGANAIEFSGGTANPTGIGGTTNGVYIWEAAGETGASGLTYVMRASSSLGFSAYIANGAGATAVCASATAVGNRTFTAAATTCTNPSSIRLKENVASMSDALDILGQLRPVSFNWKASTGITAINGGSADYGFIAEEVDNVLPELVSRDENGQIQGLSYTGFIPFLARAIQQQQAEIQALQGNAAGITGGGTVNGNLAITGSINVTGPTTLGDLTVNGNSVFNGNLTVQDIQVANITINGHIITAGNTPAIATGAAAGTADPLNNIAAPTATVDGNDTAGTITIVAGANTTTGSLVELTFNTPFTKSPKVMLNAGNADTANLKFYRDAQTGKFTIKLSQAPDANKTYQFDYWVAQ